MLNADAALQLFPAWRQVEADLVAGGLQPGQIIDRRTLEQAFGVRFDAARTPAEFESARLLFLSQFTNLRQSLLRKHRLMLRAIHGVGWQVVMPSEQTGVAMRSRTAEARRALDKLADEISFVRTEELTDAERKENSDAIAKMGALRSMVSRELLPD